MCHLFTSTHLWRFGNYNRRTLTKIFYTWAMIIFSALLENTLICTGTASWVFIAKKTFPRFVFAITAQPWFLLWFIEYLLSAYRQTSKTLTSGTSVILIQARCHDLKQGPSHIRILPISPQTVHNGSFYNMVRIKIQLVTCIHNPVGEVVKIMPGYQTRLFAMQRGCAVH